MTIMISTFSCFSRFVDVLHSGMVISCIWFWLVQHFGDQDIHDTIPW